jgi:hypothetical protein
LKNLPEQIDVWRVFASTHKQAVDLAILCGG